MLPSRMMPPTPERGFGLTNARGSRAQPPTVPYRATDDSDSDSAAPSDTAPSTGRRARFVFGFASLPHLLRGCRGRSCRGTEHTVVLMWSLTSGKRQVLLNGEEVHASVAARSVQKFAVAFPLLLPTEGGGEGGCDNRVMIQLAAWASPTFGAKPSSGCKQFDLRLDGRPFAELPTIDELGGERWKRMYGDASAAYGGVGLGRSSTRDLPREGPEELSDWEVKADGGAGTPKVVRKAGRSGSGGGATSSIQRKGPDCNVAQRNDGDGAYVKAEEARDPSEEDLVSESARQASSRDGANDGEKYSALSSAAKEEGQIPRLVGVPGVFQLRPPPPSPNRHRQRRPGQKKQANQTMKITSQSTNLIDPSSVVPSQSLQLGATPFRSQSKQQQSPSSEHTVASSGATPFADSAEPRLTWGGQTDETSNPTAMGNVVVATGTTEAWSNNPRPGSPGGTSFASFASAPPPTWEQMNAAFAPQAMSPSVAASQAAASPCPSVVGVGVRAPTDASASVHPIFGSSFFAPPPPTFEQMSAAFSSPQQPPEVRTLQLHDNNSAGGTLIEL